MKTTNALAAVLLALGLGLVACSGSDEGTGDKQTTSPTSSRKDEGSTDDRTPSRSSNDPSNESDTPSSSQECRSSSLNGLCLAGPNKGKSCCYAPLDEEDPPCASSNLCDNVCEYCE